MSNPGTQPDRPLDRLLAWARRCLRRSVSVGLEPEDLVQDALVKALQRSVFVRDRASGAEFFWLRRAMEYEMAHHRRRRGPSSRPRRATPLPWGKIELVGELTDGGGTACAPPPRLPRDPFRAGLNGAWNERVSLLLVDFFGSSWETSAFLLGGRSRDATRRLVGRARTRLQR